MKKLMFFGLGLLSVLLFMGLQSCGTSLDSDYEELDLMRHGLPIKVMAPADVKIETSTSLGVQTVTIDGGTDFAIEISKGEFNSGSRDNLLNEQKEFVTSNRIFHQILLEEADGFVYEFKINEENSNFGFRRVYIQGDYEYIFRNGMAKIFTEEQAMNMFNAVKQ
jgi:hypothetical protein